ncbi:hypothetical protein H0H87_008471 [Tephrocybe sp. NHM501043]|nr:hypothetical protein H0H87_008471 [Tephrocybe sp. NHM501043]
MAATSARLTKLYDALPQDAQRRVLEKHLFSLLDTLPEDASNNVLSAVMEMQSRYRTMPKLDLKGKKKEISSLMDALHLDAKLDITRASSNREELQAEVVNSLTSWLNDIWSVVYEYHDDYHQAHVCLLFTADVARSLSEMQGRVGCKCALMNLPIDVSIKARDGSTVKSFALRGPNSLDRAVLWIWREMFVSMLAHGTPSVKRRIPGMFDDIEMTMGWDALERLLYGGNPSMLDEYEGAEDDNYYGQDEEFPDEDIVDYVDEDGDEDYVDEDSHHPGGMCSFHAAHWPPVMEECQVRLRELVEECLHTHFCIMPSLRMFEVIRAISVDPDAADDLLLKETHENATKSPDTFGGALEIYVSKDDAYKIQVILDSHSYLLRPRDTEVLQSAVRVLNDHGFAPFGMQIFERELFESIRTIYAAVTGVFGNVGLDEHKMEIDGILKLRFGSPERKERIQQWTDVIMTHSAPMNPLAFAAMMMGFPMGGPGVQDGGPEDPAGFLDDVDELDPDWEDLKEEFRPPLKDRFDGWHNLSSIWKDGTAMRTVLSNTYAKALQLMPFLRSSDIVDCMIVR